jgi:25S rRNA (uracil2634-N3)-methyltransferase
VSLPGEAKKWDADSYVGKGITDQDRNILSNQLLVLAFLRSAASVLATGSVPTIFKPRKRMKDDDDDDDGVQQGPEDEDEDMLNAVEKTRGSILITLRNVSPYTLWCAWL